MKGVPEAPWETKRLEESYDECWIMAGDTCIARGLRDSNVYSFIAASRTLVPELIEYAEKIESERDQRMRMSDYLWERDKLIEAHHAELDRLRADLDAAERKVETEKEIAAIMTNSRTHPGVAKNCQVNAKKFLK